jgi:hypothetical protein
MSVFPSLQLLTRESLVGVGSWELGVGSWELGVLKITLLLSRAHRPLNPKPADVGHDGAGLAGAVFAGELALIGDGAMLRAIRRAWVYGFAAKMKILLAGMAGWPAADFFIQIEQRHLALHGLGVSDLANQAARRRGRHGWWPLSHWLARLCAGWFQISPGLAWLSAPADAPCR